MESCGRSRRFVTPCKTGVLCSKAATGRSRDGPAAPDAVGERGARQSPGENKQPEGSGCAKTILVTANKDVQYWNIYIYSLSSAPRASPAGQLPFLEPQPGWEVHRGWGQPALSCLHAPGSKDSASPRHPEGSSSSKVLCLINQGPWEESRAGCRSPLPSPHLGALLPRAGGMLRWDARRDALAHPQTLAMLPSTRSGWDLCTPVSTRHVSAAEPSPWR